MSLTIPSFVFSEQSRKIVYGHWGLLKQQLNDVRPTSTFLENNGFHVIYVFFKKHCCNSHHKRILLTVFCKYDFKSSVSFNKVTLHFPLQKTFCQSL